MPATDHHRVRVLVVDDHEETLELLHDLLTPRGFDVHTASNAREAMDVAAMRMPEVIVTDLQMPGEDGFALCKSLRRSACHGEGAIVPVLALTGSSDATVDERAADAGFSEVLRKPCAGPTLATALCRALVREHAAARQDARALGFTRADAGAGRARRTGR
jgi:two-component system capsular synthesis sensor histidine kinase RcsC